MSGITPGPEQPLNPYMLRGIDGLLSVQRPAVLAHIRAIRRQKPDASPAELIRMLEFRYLSAVTTGGALVGASAVLPAVGVGASLALSAAETAVFLEASALFAQSVTEVHGIAIENPDRARALVMTMMLGTAGTDLVRQLAGQVSGTGPARNAYWGEIVTKNLPRAAVGQVADTIKRTFIKRFAATQGTNIIGRAIPFGVGAVIGGTGNHLLGRKVIASSRSAFGPAPDFYPLGLEPKVKELRVKAPKAPKVPKAPKAPKAIKAAKTPKEPQVRTAITAPTASEPGQIGSEAPRRPLGSVGSAIGTAASAVGGAAGAVGGAVAGAVTGAVTGAVGGMKPVLERANPYKAIEARRAKKSVDEASPAEAPPTEPVPTEPPPTEVPPAE